MRFTEVTDRESQALNRRGKSSTLLFLILLAFILLFATEPAHPQQPSKEPPLISATGIGRPPADASSPTQAKAMAERAAFLQALREAAKKSGRSVPPDYTGPIRVGTTVKGFRVTRITPLPDGSAEVEVSLPRAGASP